MGINSQRKGPLLVPPIAKAIGHMFKNAAAFVTAPFMQIFYRGIDVDCSASDLTVETVCVNFHTGAIKGTVQVNRTFFQVSLLGGVSNN